MGADIQAKEAPTRAWRAVAASVVGVVAIASGLLYWFQQRRTVELRHQYTTIAAHEGRKVELKYGSYRRVVDNVTHISSGDANQAAAALVKSGEFTERLKRTSELRKSAEQRAKLLRARELDVKTVATAAKDAATSSSGSANVAMEQCRHAADVADSAQRAAERTGDEAGAACKLAHDTETAVEEARKAAGVARGADPAADKTSAPGAQAETSTSADTHVATAQAAADDASRQCADREEAASRDKSSADVKLKAAYLACTSANLAQAQVATAGATAAALDDALSHIRGTAQAAALEAKADGAAAENVAGLLRLFDNERSDALERIQVLPDQLPDLVQTCLTPHAGGPPMPLCIAQEIARLTEVRHSVDVVACPAGITDREPLLLSEGRVIVPPRMPNELTACGSIKLDALFSNDWPRVSPDTDDVAVGFDEAVVLGADGKALADTNAGTNVRVLTLPGFDGKAVTSTRVMEGVVIGGEKYRAFLQPIAVPVTPLCDGKPCAQGGSEHLFFCGLVREDRLLLDSFRVSPPVSLLIALLLAITVLALPLAKLWLTGPRTVFTRLDVTVLAVSALATTLLACVLSCALLATARLSSRLDRQLEHTSTEVGARLKHELDAAHATFDDREQKARPIEEAITHDASRPKEPPTMPGACRAARGQARRFNASPVQVCEQTRAVGTTNDRVLFFLTDPDGFQVLKSTTAEHATNPINVADRAYFKDAMQHRSSDATIQIVRSATTSAIVLVVSRSFGAAGSPPDGVAALESPLPAYGEKAVLPLGFESFVVDGQGTVMVDTSQNAQPGQSLFDELDSSSELQALLGARVSDGIDVRHLGADSRLYVQPIAGTDWSVVTVAPKNLIYAPVVDTVIVTVLLYTLVLVALLAIVTVLAVWAKHRGAPAVSVRPSLTNVDRYRSAGRWLIGVAAASCVLGFFPIGSMVGKLAIMTVVTVAALLKVPGLGPVHDPTTSWAKWIAKWQGQAGPRSLAPAQRPPARLARAYLTCCVGLASVLVMAPATIIFFGAHDQLLENLVRAEQDHFSRALDHRPTCWKAVAGEWPSPECADVYGSGEERAVASGGGLELLCPNSYTPLAWTVDHIPALGFGSRCNARLDRVRGDENHALRWTWRRAWNELTLCNPTPRVSSAMFLGVRDLWPIVGAAAIFILFIAAASLVSYHSLRRLLLFDVLASRSTSSETSSSVVVQACKDAARGIVLFAPDGLAEKLRNVGYVDLFSLPAGTPAPERVYAEIDRKLDDAAAAKIVEATASKSIIVISSVNPLRRLSDGAHKAWVDALHRFVRIPTADRPSPFAGENADHPTHAAYVWSESDPDEQRVLAQLVLYGFPNPHPENWPILEHLRARGLLTPDALELADDPRDSLAKYIRAMVTAADRQSWTEDGAATIWSSVRVSLSTAVVVLLGIVGVSRPELAAVGPVAPALAAGLPTVIKLLTSLSDGRRT